MGQVTREGIVHGLPEAEYHRGPELSSTGAKTLLDVPARYAWQRTHGRPDKTAYDFGHLIHELILGVGQGIHVAAFDSWRTKAAQEASDAARRRGEVPVLRKDLLEASAARREVRRHPIAGRLIQGGTPEVSVFWTDEETQVACRGRIDYLTKTRTGRDLIVDVKSTREGGANPARFGRSVHDYRYHLQAAWYLAGAVATGLVQPDAGYLFLIVETTPPHPVTVARLDDDALTLGHSLMRRALDLYRTCTLTGEWPSYSAEVAEISLPPWAWKESA